MGTYVYTCRAEKKVFSGVVIGRFSFAYKIGREGWVPGCWTSNKSVLSLESIAEKARASFGEKALFIMAPALTKKAIEAYSIKGKGAPVYEIPKSMFQFVEYLEQAPVGYLTVVAGKVVYTPVAA